MFRFQYFQAIINGSLNNLFFHFQVLTLIYPISNKLYIEFVGFKWMCQEMKIKVRFLFSHMLLKKTNAALLEENKIFNKTNVLRKTNRLVFTFLNSLSGFKMTISDRNILFITYMKEYVLSYIISFINPFLFQSINNFTSYIY